MHTFLSRALLCCVAGSYGLQIPAPVPSETTAGLTIRSHVWKDSAHIHTIQTGFINRTDSSTNCFRQPYTAAFLQAMRNGSTYLRYQGDTDTALRSLNEAAQYASCYSIQYWRQSDSLGPYLLMTDASARTMQAAVRQADQAWELYYQQVAAACSSLNRNTTDRDLVSQIHRYIVNGFYYNYSLNTDMYTFMRTRIGQCFHYAHLFTDMCKAMGIPSEYVENAAMSHAWSRVLVDGTVYTFDPTYSQSTGSLSAYAWLRYHPVFESGPVQKTTALVLPASSAGSSQNAGRWVKSAGQWSYIQKDGSRATGWKQIVYNGMPSWFYFNQNGIMQTDWLKYGNDWYYLKKSGVMVTGWMEQKKGSQSVWYCFRKNGTMFANGWYGKYCFDASGACLNP